MENSSNSANSIESTQNESDPTSGCGCSNITISVNPTTGGQFDLAVTKNDTIENLKKLISKKLKVPKERICLLYRERQLRDGTIQENQLVNGSRLTLLPSVETGLLAQRPEQSVMQALESLNDCQVNDFLSGKAPLNLTMRLGDHMMLIQLQLSTVTPNSSSSSTSGQSSSSNSSSTTHHITTSRSSKRALVSPNKSSTSALSGNTKMTTSPYSPLPTTQNHKDPLASLSSIVESTTPSPPTPSTSNTSSIGNIITATPTTIVPPNVNNTLTNTSNSSTVNNTSATTSSSALSSSSTTTTTSIPPSHTTNTTSSTSDSTSISPPSTATSNLLEGCKCDSTTTKPVLDTRALAEASRNLTQTLKQLSSEVLTSKSDPVEDVTPSAKRRQGAIIESMHHHGKGVYSGTFSGTLNPALQDRFGRPKRDISTIIHILNDLLCATPQYRNCRGTASSSNSSSSSSSSNNNSTNFSSSSTNNLDKNSNSSMTGALTSAEPEASTNNAQSTSESLENQATRGKMERLRLIMEERREKRRAARSSPYARNLNGQPAGMHLNSIGGINHTQWSAKSETQRTNTSTTSNTATDQPNIPMDTDLCTQPEVSPEPVVA